MAKFEDNLYEELFKGQESKWKQSVIQVKCSELYEAHNHPFQVRDDEAMEELTESIKQQGIITPLLIRRDCGNPDIGYEIIAGHRRRHAAMLAGLEEVPAILMECDNQTFDILMVDSNLNRPELLPSELAFAYKIKMEALKHKGKKLPGGESAKQVGGEMGKSDRTIRRFIRLTMLIPDILHMVDDKRISLTIAYDLTFLEGTEQYKLYEILTEYKVKIKSSQSVQLKQKKEAGEILTYSDIKDMLIRKEEKKKGRLVIKEEYIRQYFPEDAEKEEIENIILTLLKEWSEKQRAVMAN